MIKKIILVGLLALSVSACSKKTDTPANPNQTTAEQAITQAKLENQKVAKLGFEWTTTKDLIKQAEQLTTEGKFDQAIDLANKAKRQALNGQKQADRAKTASKNLF